MKIPSCRRFNTKSGRRLTINGKVIPQHSPTCDACGIKRKHGEPNTYHVFLWGDTRSAKLAIIPITFCYACAIEFSKNETCEFGYVSHADLVESGMENLVIFEAQKGEKC